MTTSSSDIHNADSRREELAAGLKDTRASIEKLAQEAGRTDIPELLPVTKFHPAEDIALVAGVGVTDVAQNRQQEERANAQEVSGMRFRVIGQVQAKKASQVAPWPHAVLSVESKNLSVALIR